MSISHPDDTLPIASGRSPTRYATAAGCFGVAAWALLLAGTFTIADLDMFHEMALFREALSQGWIPRRDTFAYTPTVYPVVHHEWGTGAALYAVAVTTGLGGGGIMLLKYALIALLLAACAWCARLRGATGPLATAMAPLGVILLAVGFASMRAQLFSLVLLAVLLVLLEMDRRGRRAWIAAWLPLYVLWLNLHGGFVVGAGVFALHALERLVRALLETRRLPSAFQQTWHLFATGAAMLPLTLINPYGWEYVPFLWHALALDRPTMAEWKPLWDPIHHRMVIVLYAASLLPPLYALVVRGPRAIWGLPLLLVTAWLGLRHARHTSLYALVWLCYVPAWLAATGLSNITERFYRRLPAAVAIAWLILGAALLYKAVDLRFWHIRVPNRAQGQGQGFPVGAVDYLASQGFSGNLMTPFEAGSYVSWKLHPRVKVSMDSRFEVAYPPGLLEESNAFYSADDGWRQTLDRYPTDAVLAATGGPADDVMTKHTSWRRAYTDDAYTVFVRPDFAGPLPAVDRAGSVLVGEIP